MFFHIDTWLKNSKEVIAILYIFLEFISENKFRMHRKHVQITREVLLAILIRFSLGIVRSPRWILPNVRRIKKKAF
jgi:hypothetical protein